jgi:hypothetical protein
MRGAAAVVVLVVAILAGCGGGGHQASRRDLVNAYITQVDAAAAALVGERARIDRTLRRFSLTSSTPAEVKRLRRVEAQIRGVARKVRRLTPPPEAAELHAELLRLLSLEATVASHLAWTAEFVPKLTRALRPVTPAANALALELKRAKTWQADADAYARYRDALLPVVDTLARLDPPPELRATVAAQTRQLRLRAELSDGLAAALAKKDVKAVNAGLRRFAALASQEETDRSYRAQVAMTRAYNGRLDRISALAVRIARERQKLVAEVG